MEEVNICVPAYNEEDVILPTIDALCALCDSLPQYKWVITLVDNNSTDTTLQRMKEYVDTRLCVLQQPQQGKGAALSLAAQKNTSDFFVFIDADLSADLKQIPLFLEKIKSGFDVVVGSRFLDTAVVHRSFWRTTTSHLFRWYAEQMVPIPVSDSQCPLKMMNKRGVEILASCKDAGWFIDRELLAKAEKRRLSIIEMPIAWEEFRYPERKSKLNVARAGLQSIVSLWRIRTEVYKYPNA